MTALFAVGVVLSAVLVVLLGTAALVALAPWVRVIALLIKKGIIRFINIFEDLIDLSWELAYKFERWAKL